jgi:hypothetical protein
MRAVVSHLKLVVVILVAMLGMGRGLPGIVSALRVAPSHVCTCSTGGDHASCPICNPTFEEHRRSSASSAPTATGLPCGNGRLAIVSSGEVGTLPTPVAWAAPPLERLAAPRARPSLIRDVLLEPATPPPRFAAT